MPTVNSNDGSISPAFDDSERTQTSQTKTRVRLKSPRLQLQVTLQRMEKLAQSDTLKEAKAADLLMSMAELQKMLLQLTLDEKKDTLEGEHAALSAQHTADTQRIQALEAQNTELRRDACRVKTVTVPDPEHEKVRRKNDMLKSVLSLLITQIDREQVAVRALRELPADAASSLCDALGINYREYAQYLIIYKTERDLLNVVERADPDADTSLLRFCRAALAVNQSLNLASEKSKSADAARHHSVQEELIESERQENADRQATMDIAWRRQMGL